eukprot:3009393-Amphidinium_carterae.1
MFAGAVGLLLRGVLTKGSQPRVEGTDWEEARMHNSAPIPPTKSKKCREESTAYQYRARRSKSFRTNKRTEQNHW